MVVVPPDDAADGPLVALASHIAVAVIAETRHVALQHYPEPVRPVQVARSFGLDVHSHEVEAGRLRLFQMLTYRLIRQVAVHAPRVE